MTSCDIIQVINISKNFGQTMALDQVSFTIKEGETLCIIGMSGSGKSTLLKMINQLLLPSKGQIIFDGKNIESFVPIELRRQIGYVLQQPALFPHWTIRKNIGLVPRLLNWPSEKIQKRIDELLQLMQLPSGHFADRYPSQLSGGQQQRVGIARALAARPKAMLYDEPFSSLDPMTRSDLRKEVLYLKKNLNITNVFVTHHIREAFSLGDKVLILHKGRKIQHGTPDEIRSQPANEFVTEFIKTGYEE